MSSHTVQQGFTLLRASLARQSIRHPKNFKLLHQKSRSLHAKTSIAYGSAASGRAGLKSTHLAALAGVVAASSVAAWLHQNGIQVQLLQSALADEPVTPHVALDETPIHRRLTFPRHSPCLASELTILLASSRSRYLYTFSCIANSDRILKW